MKKKKESLVGWVVRDFRIKFKRDYWTGDTFTLCIRRGNPNPSNYTKTNHFSKVRITIQEI